MHIQCTGLLGVCVWLPLILILLHIGFLPLLRVRERVICIHARPYCLILDRGTFLARSPLLCDLRSYFTMTTKDVGGVYISSVHIARSKEALQRAAMRGGRGGGKRISVYAYKKGIGAVYIHTTTSTSFTSSRARGKTRSERRVKGKHTSYAP